MIPPKERAVCFSPLRIGVPVNPTRQDTGSARRIAVAHRSFNDSRLEGTTVVVNKSIAMNKVSSDSARTSRFQRDADAGGSSPALDVSA